VIPIMVRRKIHYFAEAAMPQAEIACRVGCSERSVRNILCEPSPDQVQEVPQTTVRRAGAPSKTESFADQARALLLERPSVPTVEVLRLARSWGYEGGDSAFFELVKRIRPPKTPVEPMVRFDGLPGEFAQFDFGEVQLTYGDGSEEKVHFFAGCLKYSRMKHVVVTPDQKAERLVRATIACLQVFGGAPKQWVYDNPKTVWVDRSQGRKELHDYLRQLVMEMNVLVEPCTPRMANQKGAVENLVGFIKKNFFLAYQFANHDDMIRQLAEWLHRVNYERPSDATKEIPIKRLESELPRLNTRKVPWSADDFPLRESAMVSPTGSIKFLNTGYSVDPRFIGAPATLFVKAKTIRIDAGKSTCEHVREDFTGEIHRLPEHSLIMTSVITAERKQTYFKRQCLLELGPAAQIFLDRLIMRAHGNSWYKDIHRLFDIYQSHGQKNLLKAMEIATIAGEPTFNAVKSALKEVG
jgi:transposase